MISHAMYGERDVLVVDSVAGNDAFGTTLFLNDVLVFVVKPEREDGSVGIHTSSVGGVEAVY